MPVEERSVEEAAVEGRPDEGEVASGTGRPLASLGVLLVSSAYGWTRRGTGALIARSIFICHFTTTTLWLGRAKCVVRLPSSSRSGSGSGAERKSERSSRRTTSLAGP